MEKIVTSSRPYIIRAIYEWIADNGLTPYILVDTRFDSVLVPENYIENNRIILNISPTATHDLSLGNDGISFNARFNGLPTDIYVPAASVLAIYAQENGQGMMFGEAGENDPKPPVSGSDADIASEKSTKTAEKKTKPSLKIVKYVLFLNILVQYQGKRVNEEFTLLIY